MVVTGPITHQRKKNLITETRMQEQNCIERLSVMIPDNQDLTVVEHLT